MTEHYRRGQIRVPFETSIELNYNGENTVYKRTHDVSMNGIFVSTANPLPKDGVGKFNMMLGVGMRKENILGEFRVVRVVTLDEGLSDEKPTAGMALRFEKFEAESGETLFQLVRHNE